MRLRGERTNNTLIQGFESDNANELVSATRDNNLLTVAGSVSNNVTALAINGQGAALYHDGAYAVAGGVPLAAGLNVFTGVVTVAGVTRTNQLSTALPVTVTLRYDANGNLIWDGLIAYGYDNANELTSVTVTNCWRTQYKYDGLGRRRVRTDYAWLGLAWVATNGVWYVYDGMTMLQERTTNNVPLVTYTRGVDLSGSMQGAGGIGGLLARTDGNGSTFYHADGNGNVTALVNGSGTVVAKYLYDSFGNTLGMWGSLAAGNTYRYSSKEVDLRSEAYYYGYRYYQPNLQRWVNRDPIGESGGINLYGYVGNNPSRYYDPYGLSLSSWLQGAVNGWNGLFPDPSQSGSEESYWGNMANNDQQTENAIGAPSGYMVNQRQQMQNLENAVPSDIYVFVGCGKEINGKGAEALGLMGGNMMTGNTYFGGIGAAQLEPFGGGGEWTSSDGLTPIGFYDSGFGPGAYMSGGGNGVFFSTPTPVFIGIGLGWSTK